MKTMVAPANYMPAARCRLQGPERTQAPPALLLECDAELAKLAVGDRRWGVAHQVGAARGLGERDHIANRRLAGQEHHQAVQAEGDAAVGRGAVLQRVEQETEAAARFVVAETERREDLRLYVAAMNTD